MLAKKKSDDSKEYSKDYSEEYLKVTTSLNSSSQSLKVYEGRKVGALRNAKFEGLTVQLKILPRIGERNTLPVNFTNYKANELVRISRVRARGPDQPFSEEDRDNTKIVGLDHFTFPLLDGSPKHNVQSHRES